MRTGLLNAAYYSSSRTLCFFHALSSLFSHDVSYMSWIVSLISFFLYDTVRQFIKQNFFSASVTRKEIYNFVLRQKTEVMVFLLVISLRIAKTQQPAANFFGSRIWCVCTKRNYRGGVTSSQSNPTAPRALLRLLLVISSAHVLAWK
jgi:hypothetical protein